ncbi:tRNA preQ1(34) S-adenosylmethionine ribosyltransferase-isomerase QueA [Candidatus Saccharibacteria bacterium]|nr:tRNA preQ1(34) S-adenosylmethionine ribosyltransferase-isomerase QueA [Candidatus Saccharibacteria bacterium]
MLVSDFNYNLPEERIAKYPPKERGTTRLLVLNRETGELKDSHYQDLDQFLKPGDVLVLNDTKVMPSRLFTTLPDGRERELVVLEKHEGELGRVMYRGKLHEGDTLTVGEDRIVVKKLLGGGIAEVESTVPLVKLVERHGAVPLPPYLHRDADASDRERYQTVWAKQTGSAAAPTASLNMTKELLARLEAKGIIIRTLTLHVGLGTFLPIRSDNVEDHHMHSEWYHIPDDTIGAISAAKSSGRRIIAVGTTVARTLEYYAKTHQPAGEDDIFIYPGFKFQLVDALLTNFHAPKSTVLMLAAAFAGWDHLHRAYDHAVKEKYNFLSYGDSMLIYTPTGDGPVGGPPLSVSEMGDDRSGRTRREDNLC